MTKTVRIENADTSDYKVVVITQDLQADGTWKEVARQSLDYPTAMSNGTYLTSTRRIVVEEAPHVA